jgi:hypothetical protein
MPSEHSGAPSLTVSCSRLWASLGLSVFEAFCFFICPFTPRPAGAMTADSDLLNASWCCQMFFLKRDSFSSPGGSHVFFLLASTEISLSRHFCLNTSDKNGSPLCVSSAPRNAVARKDFFGSPLAGVYGSERVMSTPVCAAVLGTGMALYCV